MTIVCVGDVFTDVVAHLPGPLAAGSDTPAPIRTSGGGSAANTAAWIAAAGGSVTLVGRVGADGFGRALLDDLAHQGIDLAVSVDPDRPTGICIVLVAPDGERTMIPSAGASASPGTIPPLRPGDRLHVSGYAIFHDAVRPEVERALADAHAVGVPVSIDAASTAPLRAFGAARFLALCRGTLLFANRDEAAVLTGSDDPRESAPALAASCAVAIVKRGAHGVICSDGATVAELPAFEYSSLSGRAIVPVDTTGAGDALAAGVLVALAAGAGMDEALRAGMDLAARAVTRAGGRPGC